MPEEPLESLESEVFYEHEISKELESPKWNLEVTGIYDAREIFNTRGEGVNIGIIDTGIDSNHPDLKGRPPPKWIKKLEHLGRIENSYHVFYREN